MTHQSNVLGTINPINDVVRRAHEAGALVLVGAPLGPEIRIEAIGSPSALQAVLSRAGGIIGRIAVAQPDVVIEVMPRETPLVLPATTRDLRPQDAKPRI